MTQDRCFSNVYSCLLWTFTVIVHVNIVGPTKCLKRDEIEERDGNVYFCKDPDLPTCCEVDSTFTCCMENWKMAAQSQMGILLVIFLAIVLLVFLCCLARCQWQVFEKDTAKEACCDIKEKISRKFTRNSKKTERFDRIANEATKQT